jgi:hypothetical protein
VEFTAAGFEARTVLPSEMRKSDVTVVLRKLPSDGDPVEVGRFAYAYHKGAKDNPWETRWLNPIDSMLCGFLWETPVEVSRVEVEFPAGAVLSCLN